MRSQVTRLASRSWQDRARRKPARGACVVLVPVLCCVSFGCCALVCACCALSGFQTQIRTHQSSSNPSDHRASNWTTPNKRPPVPARLLVRLSDQPGPSSTRLPSSSKLGRRREWFCSFVDRLTDISAGNHLESVQSSFFCSSASASLGGRAHTRLGLATNDESNSFGFIRRICSLPARSSHRSAYN